MIDYTSRIKDRAKICNAELTEADLLFLNKKVNSDVARGCHESDALDYAYFSIKNKIVNEPMNSKRVVIQQEVIVQYSDEDSYLDALKLLIDNPNDAYAGNSKCRFSKVDGSATIVNNVDKKPERKPVLILQQGRKGYGRSFHSEERLITMSEAKKIVSDYDREFKIDTFAYTKRVDYTPEEWFDKKFNLGKK